MDNDFVYLSSHQGFALVDKISELKENPYFRDELAESFIKEVYTRATEITVNSLNTGTNILSKLRKNGNKIKISKSKFEYITRLTGIDVFDEETINQFISKVNKANPEIEQTNLRRR